MTNLLPAGQFAGFTAGARVLPEMRFVETTYRAGEVLREHAHEHAHFCFVLDGSFTESVQRTDARRGPLCVTFLPEHCPHGESHHTAGRHFIVEFKRDSTDLFGDIGPPHAARLVGSRATRYAARLYAEFRSPRSLDSSASDLVVELLATCSQPPAIGHPRWLTRTRESIRDRFDSTLSLNQLALEAAVHPVHLAQSFRRVYGETVGEFIRQLRVEYACHSLIVGRAPLSEIAAAAGFADQSHLTRCFRRAMGVTPGEYRRLVSDNSPA